MKLLAHRDVAVAVLGSGSKGNAIYVGDGRTGVLVDCGLSALQVQRRLDEVGLGDAPIDAVLVTHEHSDHVAAAAVLDRKVEARSGAAPVFYMTPGTRARLHPSSAPRRVEPVSAGRCFRIGALEIQPHAVPHDAREPVAYAIQTARARVGVITDLGRSTRIVAQMLSTLDVAVLEFNHDLEMLVEGAYPWRLKERIRGPQGHLSNDQAADLLAQGAGPRLAHLVLAHLSEENNTPEKARRSADEVLCAIGRTDVRVHVAAQGTPVRVPLAAPAAAPPAAPQMSLF